jgi:hypothetical protein
MVMIIRPDIRPQDFEDALDLAAEIARFDSDYLQFNSLAAHLLKQTWWGFWWD